MYLPFTSVTPPGVGTAVEQVTTDDLLGSELCDILSSFKEDNLVFLSTVQGMAIFYHVPIKCSQLVTFLLHFSYGVNPQLIKNWKIYITY